MLSRKGSPLLNTIILMLRPSQKVYLLQQQSMKFYAYNQKQNIDTVYKLATIMAAARKLL